MRRRIIVAGLGLALTLAFGSPGPSFAEEPDSAAVEPPPPVKRTRLSAPT